jgi:quinolinate synthase
VLLQAYGDAYLTAHFEVPGEMFRLAMRAKARGMGVVGSTSNILDFIAGRVQEAVQQPYGQRLTFVLGTEAGMITSIVRKVQALLGAAGRDDVEVEVVFPVNPRAITTPQQQVAAAGGVGQAAAVGQLSGGLALVPGPAGGEGCSLEGGCASCPYMKMNSLAALMTVTQRVGDAAGEALLEGFRPRTYTDRVGGKSVAQAGCEPILHMRYFTQHKRFSPELVSDILSRNASSQP